jgi:protocadherin Fat 1/2/3
LAQDEDIGKNGKIQYSIKSGKGKGKFKIHPDTGMVYSQKGFEAGQEFDMIVSNIMKLISINTRLLCVSILFK